MVVVRDRDRDGYIAIFRTPDLVSLETHDGHGLVVKTLDECFGQVDNGKRCPKDLRVSRSHWTSKNFKVLDTSWIVVEVGTPVVEGLMRCVGENIFAVHVLEGGAFLKKEKEDEQLPVEHDEVLL